MLTDDVAGGGFGALRLLHQLRRRVATRAIPPWPATPRSTRSWGPRPAAVAPVTEAPLRLLVRALMSLRRHHTGATWRSRRLQQSSTPRVFTLVDGDDPGPSRPLETPHAPARGPHTWGQYGLASSALDHR